MHDSKTTLSAEKRSKLARIIASELPPLSMFPENSPDHLDFRDFAHHILSELLEESQVKYVIDLAMDMYYSTYTYATSGRRTLPAIEIDVTTDE